jgi:hypothetical protein
MCARMAALTTAREVLHAGCGDWLLVSCPVGEEAWRSQRRNAAERRLRGTQRSLNCVPQGAVAGHELPSD